MANAENQTIEQPTKDWTISGMILCSLYVDNRPQTPDDVVDFITIHLYGNLIELGYDPAKNDGWKKTVKSLMAIKQFIERVKSNNRLCQYRLIEKKLGEIRENLLNQTRNSKLYKLIVEQQYDSLGPIPANDLAVIATPKKRGRKPKRQLVEQATPQKVNPNELEHQSPSGEPLAKRMKIIQERNAGTPGRSRVSSVVVTPLVCENLRSTRARTLAPEATNVNLSPLSKEARSRKASESPSINRTPKGNITITVPIFSDSKLVVKRGRGRPRKIQPPTVE